MDFLPYIVHPERGAPVLHCSDGDEHPLTWFERIAYAVGLMTAQDLDDRQRYFTPFEDTYPFL